MWIMFCLPNNRQSILRNPCLDCALQACFRRFHFASGESATSYRVRDKLPVYTTHMQTIRIRGARTHNLRNIDLDLPRDRLIVITGLSGSGKSSLAFDTIFAEGQRRYVESLSAYARQFLAM